MIGFQNFISGQNNRVSCHCQSVKTRILIDAMDKSMLFVCCGSPQSPPRHSLSSIRQTTFCPGALFECLPKRLQKNVCSWCLLCRPAFQTSLTASRNIGSNQFNVSSLTLSPTFWKPSILRVVSFQFFWIVFRNETL